MRHRVIRPELASRPGNGRIRHVGDAVPLRLAAGEHEPYAQMLAQGSKLAFGSCIDSRIGTWPVFARFCMVRQRVRLTRRIDPATDPRWNFHLEIGGASPFEPIGDARGDHPL